MFAELQDENVVDIVKMDEVLRQKTEATKAIVKHISDFQQGSDLQGLKKAFETLENNKFLKVVESKIDDKDVRKLYLQQQVMNGYLASEDCIILTASRAEKNSINLKLRNTKSETRWLKTAKNILPLRLTLAQTF